MNNYMTEREFEKAVEEFEDNMTVKEFREVMNDCIMEYSQSIALMHAAGVRK